MRRKREERKAKRKSESRARQPLPLQSANARVRNAPYVYPTVFVTLNTSASITIGKNERLNLRIPTKRRRIHAPGKAYIAIQNIFESTALEGWEGCARESEGLGCARERGRGRGGVRTHAPRLEHPEGRPVVVYLVPEPQADEHAARDVSDRPEVEREEDHDEDRLHPPHCPSAHDQKSKRKEKGTHGKDVGRTEEPAEEIRRYRRATEEEQEEQRDRVGRLSEDVSLSICASDTLHWDAPARRRGLEVCGGRGGGGRSTGAPFFGCGLVVGCDLAVERAEQVRRGRVRVVGHVAGGMGWWGVERVEEV